MPEYLTPKQVENVAHFWKGTNTGELVEATLREYAAICQGVAEMDPHPVDDRICTFCSFGSYMPSVGQVHAPDCLWLRARRVRGME